MSADYQDQGSEVNNRGLMELDDLDALDVLVSYLMSDDAIESDSISTNPSYDSLSNTGASIKAHSDSSLSFEATNGASDNLDVKRQLQSKIMEKMKIEGKGHTFKDISTNNANDELTAEDEKKRFEKQERNKEAARKSRQKKKENSFKLEEENKVLDSINRTLKYDVQQLNKSNEAYESYLLNHRCSTRNIIAQQDHGDNVCQETGSTQLCRPIVEPYKVHIWNGEDDKQVKKISEDLDELSVSLKVDIQRPQEVEQILSSLQESQSSLKMSQSSLQENQSLLPGSQLSLMQLRQSLLSWSQSSLQASQPSLQASQPSLQENYSSPQESQSLLQGDQSELVTSGASYKTDKCLDSPSYLIERRENADYNNLSQVKTITKPNFSSNVMGNYTNVIATQYESGVFKGNGNSLGVGNSPASARFVNAWSTEMDDRNDEIEALHEVSKTVRPPPEKKLRLE